MAIVRRISLLQYFYTGRKLEAPFPDLKAASERVRTIAQDLRHQPASRYGARHGGRVDTGGLRGHIDLDLADAEALWPYLHLGQWLKVEKKASMGYGHHAVAPLRQDPAPAL